MKAKVRRSAVIWDSSSTGSMVTSAVAVHGSLPGLRPGDLVGRIPWQLTVPRVEAADQRPRRVMQLPRFGHG